MRPPTLKPQRSGAPGSSGPVLPTLATKPKQRSYHGVVATHHEQNRRVTDSPCPGRGRALRLLASGPCGAHAAPQPALKCWRGLGKRQTESPPFPHRHTHIIYQQEVMRLLAWDVAKAGAGQRAHSHSIRVMRIVWFVR